MSKNQRIKQQITLLLILLILFMGGFFLFYDGLFLTRIEIDPTGQETIVHIHKKPLIPIFKDVDIEVPKVYQAIMTRDINKFILSAFSYRVELKAPNGKIVPITSYSLLRYFSNRKLEKQINESIQNKISFTTEFRDISPLFSEPLRNRIFR